MFIQFSEHTFIFPANEYYDRPNCFLIRGSKKAVLFEAGSSESHVNLIQNALLQQKLPLPDFVACSHHHFDHSFGMHIWDCPTIACKATNRKLQEMSTWTWDIPSMLCRLEKGQEIQFCHAYIEREYPDLSKIHIATADIVFEAFLSIDLGGVTVELLHVGGPHSEDSVIAYIPADNLLLLSDAASKNFDHPSAWETFDINDSSSFKRIVNAIPYGKEKLRPFFEHLEALDFSQCITGHQQKRLTKEELLALLNVF